jgi:hypothetical protein
MATMYECQQDYDDRLPADFFDEDWNDEQDQAKSSIQVDDYGDEVEVVYCKDQWSCAFILGVVRDGLLTERFTSTEAHRWCRNIDGGKQ